MSRWPPFVDAQTLQVQQCFPHRRQTPAFRAGSTASFTFGSSIAFVLLQQVVLGQRPQICVARTGLCLTEHYLRDDLTRHSRLRATF
jgi:hypothetical protein